jgi:hypothetical protein
MFYSLRKLTYKALVIGVPVALLIYLCVIDSRSKIKPTPQPTPPVIVPDVPHVEPTPNVDPTPQPDVPVPAIVEPNFITWKQVRKPETGRGAVLGDIIAHCVDNGVYASNDYEEYAHEATHGIASDIRQYYRGTCNGVYVLNDRAVVWPIPPCTIAQALDGVEKGQVYRDTIWAYKQWNENPLYLFDELTAYTNGLQCALELDIEPAQVKHDFAAIDELRRYCKALTVYIDSHKLKYDYNKDLTTYIDFNERLLDKLQSKAVTKFGFSDEMQLEGVNKYTINDKAIGIVSPYTVAHMVPGGSSENSRSQPMRRSPIINNPVNNIVPMLPIIRVLGR